MALTYEFFGIIYSIFDIVYVILMLSCLVLLVIAGRSLQRRPEQVKSSEYLRIIAWTLIVWTIATIFIPTPVVTDPYTEEELREAFVYCLLFYVLVPNIIFLITIGWMFQSFGKSNLEFYGKNLVRSGRILMSSYVINIIRSLIYYTVLINSPEDFYQVSVVLAYIDLAIIALMIIAGIFWLNFGLKIKETTLVISAVLFIVVKVVSVLPYFFLIIALIL